MKNIDNKIKSIISDIHCTPCDNAIIINAAYNICKISDKLSTNKTCNQLHEATILESMPLNKYLLLVQRVCTEKQSKDAIQSLINILPSS